MLRFASLHRYILAGSLVLATAACDISGIGDGNALESIELNRLTGLLDSTSNKSYVCFTDQLQVVGRFSDGQAGDYSSRATWSSSNPAVVEVSNGDIQLPTDPTLAYARGTLIPRAPGTATITANFVGLKASYEVQVVAPEAFEMETSQLVLAPNTAGALSLLATIDGEELNVTRAASWSFVQDEEVTEDYASIGAATGIIVAKDVSTGITLTAKADFVLCPDFAGAQNLQASVVVSPLVGIELTREFADAPDNELVKGTTDLLKAVGTLATGDTQDLTAQLTYTAADTEKVFVGAGGVRNLVSGLAVGETTVKATWTGIDPDPEDDDVDPPTLDSNSVVFNIVEDTVHSLAIDPPEGVTLKVGSSTQLTAKATYTAVPTRTQFITRHVAWSSSDGTKLGVGNGASSGGLLVAGTEVVTATPLEITAKFTNGSGDTATTVEQKIPVCIVAADATEAPVGCPPLVED